MTKVYDNFMFAKMNFFLWHLNTSSDLLFGNNSGSSLKTFSFSVSHMSHLLELDLYGEAYAALWSQHFGFKFTLNSP